LAEHLRDVAALLDADAVLAGDRAAVADARFQDFRARIHHALDGAGLALVEEDERMEVAVAGVEDVGDPQAVAIHDSSDLAEDLGQLVPGDDAILRNVARRQPPGGSEGPLARLPEQIAFRTRSSKPHFARALFHADAAHLVG